MLKKLFLAATVAAAALALAAPLGAHAYNWYELKDKAYKLDSTPVPIELEGTLTEKKWWWSDMEVGPCSVTMKGAVWNVEEEEIDAHGEIESIKFDELCPLRQMSTGKTVCRVGTAIYSLPTELYVADSGTPYKPLVWLSDVKINRDLRVYDPEYSGYCPLPLSYGWSEGALVFDYQLKPGPFGATLSANGAYKRGVGPYAQYSPSPYYGEFSISSENELALF